MRLSRLAAAAAVVAVAATLVMPAGPVGAGATGAPVVSVFYDSTYVDTAEDGGGEAFNLVETLVDLGADVGTFEGITEADWSAAVEGIDVLAIPELEESEELGADMEPGARAAVADWVDAGGRLLVFGDSDPWPTVDAIFGFTAERVGDSLCHEGDGGCELTADAAGTEFADGPATLLYNNGTSQSTDGLPDGSTIIYEDVETGLGAVTVTPFGHGSIVFLAWDWYFSTNEEAAVDVSQIGPDQDPGWIDVLGLAIDVTATIDDVSVQEGQAAVFTITLDSPVTQDIVVDYATADGTARAGVDYTATSGSVVIEAGQTSVQVTVPTLVVDGAQGSRTFSLDVTLPYFGVPADAEGLGTITDAPVTTTTAAAAAVAVTPRFTG